MHPAFNNLPRLFRALLPIVLTNMVIFLLLRLAFWVVFHQPDDPAPTGDLLHAFYLGGKFDLQLTLLMLVPVLVLGGLRWFSPLASRVLRSVWVSYLTLFMAVILCVYAIDFGHFAYLNTRVDATVLRFLENFDISMEMVWQTYHVIEWGLLLLAVVLAYAWWLWRIFSTVARQAAPPLTWRGKWLAGVVGTLLVLLGIFGSYTYPYVMLAIVFLLLLAGLHPLQALLFDRFVRWARWLKTSATVLLMAGVTALVGSVVSSMLAFEYYPFRWSAAFFTPHVFSTSVACNPVIYFTNTLKNRSVGFNVVATRQYYPLLRDFLQVDKPDAQALNYVRHRQQTPRITTRPNIVMVFLESFAGHKSSVFGNPLHTTPHFDQLAQDGVLFTQFYAPVTGTARSVYAAVTGLPDIEQHNTSTRNPLVVNQHTLINAYQGYDKFYFIGGSASWGNIRGLLSFNIPNLRLYEEGMYSSPRMDVWGIDDLHLFDEANQVLRQQRKPFFAIIQTAGNHRPYNIPEDHRGFVLDTKPQAELEKYGFSGNDEYNSFRFMDHSIGYFIQAAKKEKYFDNTLFVFYGDHGIGGYGGAHTPEYMTKHQLINLHVPLVFYAPKLLKPQRLDKPASELDLLPTIAGMTETNFTNTTLGRDLLDPRYDTSRVAFTMAERTIGLLSENYYYRFNTSNGQRFLFDIHAKDSGVDVAAQQPQTTAQLETLCKAIYETAKYMMYHNKNEKVSKE
jgi:phosphoglycerol transferase MdoB-like AlkP superfamily enzyme